MRSVQRQFGKLSLRKGAGDNAEVTILEKEFEDAISLLEKIVRDGRTWHMAWSSITNAQYELVLGWHELYCPIIGASDGHGRSLERTSDTQIDRTNSLQEAFCELRAEFTEHISSIESRITSPAVRLRDAMLPLRKMVKTRTTKDFEMKSYQREYDERLRKANRKEKEVENARLKMESAAGDFNEADQRVRIMLPQFIEATVTMVPRLLAQLVLIQNQLLGLYYTTMHEYCEKVDIPNPSPATSDIVAAWRSSFGNCAEAGAAVPDRLKRAAKDSDRFRTWMLDRQIQAPPAGLGRAERPLHPRAPSPATTPPMQGPGMGKAVPFTQASQLAGGEVHQPRYATPTSSRSSGGGYTGNQTQQRAGTPATNTLVQKKRPPPPPPPKPFSNTRAAEWMEAEYDFEAQGEGDLSFQAGDRIKIVKKTASTKDWWEGELHGVRGSFPANYCKPL